MKIPNGYASLLNIAVQWLFSLFFFLFWNPQKENFIRECWDGKCEWLLCSNQRILKIYGNSLDISNIPEWIEIINIHKLDVDLNLIITLLVHNYNANYTIRLGAEQRTSNISNFTMKNLGHDSRDLMGN